MVRAWHSSCKQQREQHCATCDEDDVCVHETKSQFLYSIHHAETRGLLVCTYSTVLVAIVLTAVVRFGLTAGVIALPAGPCGIIFNATSTGNTTACTGPYGAFGENSTIWEGSVSDLSPQDGNLLLQLSPTLSGESRAGVESSSYAATLEYSANVYARLDDSSAWSLLLSSENVTATIPCLNAGGSRATTCGPVVLLDTIEVLGGDGVLGFPAYLFTVIWHNADVVPQLAGVGFNASYTVTFQRGVFRLGDVAVRAALSLATLGVLIWWIYALTWQPTLSVVARPRRGCGWRARSTR